jgi:uncharacterized membrane protein
MEKDSRRRVLREYLWFSLILLAVLIGFVTKTAGDGARGQSQTALTAGSELR